MQSSCMAYSTLLHLIKLEKMPEKKSDVASSVHLLRVAWSFELSYLGVKSSFLPVEYVQSLIALI